MTASDVDRQVMARVLRRAGFGTTGSEVDAASALGVEGFLASAVGNDPAADPGVIATPKPDVPLVPRPKGAVSQADKQAYQDALRRTRRGRDRR